MMWTNGYITISYVIHEFDDFVVLDNGEQYIIDYDSDEGPFFMINDTKYYLNEFMKVS